MPDMASDDSFQNKIAVITGAASGIGRMVALRLAERGCSLGLLDIDPDGMAGTRSLVAGHGRDVAIAVADVSDPEAVERAVEELKQALGGFDFLVNSAGDAHLSSILDVTMAQFEKTMRVNVWGVFNCTRAVAPSMIERGGGSIVNLSSWLGKSGRPRMSAYCASKAAVIGLTESIAHDLADHHIRVNAICPGAIDNTRMREEADRENAALGLPTAQDRAGTIPLKRLGEPADIASAIVFLLSDEAAYITGESMNVTGGLWMS